MMKILCCVVALVLVAGQEEESGDFDLMYSSEEGLYEFIYRRNVGMLWVVHNEGCYFAKLDDRHTADLSYFSQSLRGQVISAVTGSGTVQPEGTTEEEVTTMFPDPEVQYNISTVCNAKDFYLIYPDIFQCDFEQSTCAWNDNQQNPVLWQRHSGPTATALTGPDDDHTLKDGTGFYLYVDSSLGSEGQMAEVISPIFRYSEGVCLRLWYSMYGEDTGRLHIFYQDVGHPDHIRTLLNISGDQGAYWRLAEMTVPGFRGQVHIQASMDRGQRGDIAIDDISSTSGPCSHSLLFCHFDFDTNQLCKWRQTAALDDMQWVARQGDTDTAGTGPSDDQGHSPNGTYLYLEGNDGQPGDTADLESPLLKHQGPICLHFFYYMYGSGVGELDILQRVKTDSGIIETVLWQRIGEQEQRWLHSKITIFPLGPDTPIQIVIRATRGSSVASDIAIDSLIGFSGNCANRIIG